MAPLKIALLGSEVAPFAKTGGLADVVSALGKALHRRGHEVRVLLPAYGKLREGGTRLRPVPGLDDLALEFPGRSLSFGVRKAPLPDSERADGAVLEVEFLDCPELYHRNGYYTSDSDEPLRWAALCRGAVELFQRTGWSPDVVHCNDWHTAVLPLYLRTRYAWDRLFQGTRTLLSIHNIGYQGSFPPEAIEQIGLLDARQMFHQDHLAEGRMSFLETGILHASWLSTVSETYAREIQEAEQGMGLEDLLRARADHLTGIVNGVDSGEWNPESDPLIPHHYTVDDLSGKARCKKALLDRMGLEHDPEAMVIGVVSRMTMQKGFELLPDILPVLLQREDLRLVVLGSGEERYEKYFQWLRDTFPSRVGVYAGFHNELAHWIEAGADLFLMGSRYEPCGLNQMYSQLYGTVPLVRHTGGLADTVDRWDPETRTGSGFVFYEFSTDALYHTMVHALEVWRDRDAWATLMRSGMERDFSWTRQAVLYEDLYRKMLAE